MSIRLNPEDADVVIPHPAAHLHLQVGVIGGGSLLLDLEGYQPPLYGYDLHVVTDADGVLSQLYYHTRGAEGNMVTVLLELGPAQEP